MGGAGAVSLSEDPTGDGALSSSSPPSFFLVKRSKVEVRRMGGSGVKPEADLLSCGRESPKVGEVALLVAIGTVIMVP